MLSHVELRASAIAIRYRHVNYYYGKQPESASVRETKHGYLQRMSMLRTCPAIGLGSILYRTGAFVHCRF